MNFLDFIKSLSSLSYLYATKYDTFSPRLPTQGTCPTSCGLFAAHVESFSRGFLSHLWFQRPFLNPG